MLSRRFLFELCHEWKQSCFFCVFVFIFVKWGEGTRVFLFVVTSVCILSVTWNVLPFEDSLSMKILDSAQSSFRRILWKEAFSGLPGSLVFMFFQNSRVLLGFPVLGGRLMSRTLGFFLSLQPKQLLSISVVLHSKVSQTSNSGGKVLVYKKVPGLDL